MNIAEDRRSLSGETIEQGSNKDPDFAATLATNLESFVLESAQSERPSSAASHRSKNSTWRPVDQPNLAYVQTLLTRLFSLRYGDCEILIIKRAYHQLDWRDRGYLYRTDVERCCIEALEETKLPMNHKLTVDHKRVTKLVSQSDLNRDGKFCIRTVFFFFFFL